MFVGLLGVAYYAEIHHIAYFVVVQIFVGRLQYCMTASTHRSPVDPRLELRQQIHET